MPMKGRALLALLVAAASFAGCLGTQAPAATNELPPGILDPALREPLTEPIHGILGHFEHAFEGTTGVKLYVDYFLPDLPEGQKAPVILVFTPYQDPGADEVLPGQPAEAYRPKLVEYFVPRGYAVAFADVRGNHRAGGCIDQTGPEQWQDGYDYVEWLGTQEWSNGRVGMWGASYDAETQFTTAMMNPPHLATIVPVASVSNQYEWSFYQGVPYEMQPFIGMFSYFQGSAVPSTDPMDAPRYPEKLTCQPEQFGAGLDFSGDMTEFWKTRDYRGMAGNITASVLHVHGLADWNVRPVHVDPLFNDIKSEKRAVFGQWPHAFPDRKDWDALLNAWYDHFLMGRENGILDILPPVLVEDDQEGWHGMEAFPPLAQEWLTLSLSADGRLVPPGAAEDGELSLRDYPEEILTSTFLSTSGPGSDLSGVPDQLVFEWETEEELRLVGRPWVGLTARTDKASTHWVAELVVEGKDCVINDKVFQPVCDNVGYQDTRHLDGLDRPKDLTPGEPYALTIRMFPQYDVVPAGSKVKLILRHNNADVQQDTTGATSTVLLSPETPALLHLPLAPASVPLPHDELPPIYPGYLPPTA
jgi:X-Pro dipeptidyl-peptidase